MGCDSDIVSQLVSGQYPSAQAALDLCKRVFNTVEFDYSKPDPLLAAIDAIYDKAAEKIRKENPIYADDITKLMQSDDAKFTPIKRYLGEFAIKNNTYLAKLDGEGAMLVPLDNGALCSFHSGNKENPGNEIPTEFGSIAMIVKPDGNVKFITDAKSQRLYDVLPSYCGEKNRAASAAQLLQDLRKTGLSSAVGDEAPGASADNTSGSQAGKTIQRATSV